MRPSNTRSPPSLCRFIRFISFISLPVSEESFSAVTTTGVWTPWGNFPGCCSEQNPLDHKISQRSRSAKDFLTRLRYRNICCKGHTFFTSFSCLSWLKWVYSVWGVLKEWTEIPAVEIWQKILQRLVQTMNEESRVNRWRKKCILN